MPWSCRERAHREANTQNGEQPRQTGPAAHLEATPTPGWRHGYPWRRSTAPLKVPPQPAAGGFPWEHCPIQKKVLMPHSPWRKILKPRNFQQHPRPGVSVVTYQRTREVADWYSGLAPIFLHQLWEELAELGDDCHDCRMGICNTETARNAPFKTQINSSLAPSAANIDFLGDASGFFFSQRQSGSGRLLISQATPP